LEFCSGILVGDQNPVSLASEIKASVDPVLLKTRVNPIRAREGGEGGTILGVETCFPLVSVFCVIFVCTGYPLGGRKRLNSGSLPDNVFIFMSGYSFFVSTNILVERGWFDISPSPTLEGRR